MNVNYSARIGGIVGISFLFFTIKVCCVFSLELPHQGDSNEHTHYTIFIIKKKLTLGYPKSEAMGFSS